MENTEITLNGTDWSNLYIIDYAGGCGGEAMCDFLSEKIAAPFTSPKLASEIKSSAIDSFDNLYISPAMRLFHQDDITQYRGYRGIESNALFHSEEMMKHNLKVNLIHRDENMSQKMESSTEDERDSLIRSSHFDKNYILRSHRNTNWSSFTNAKVIRIYPWIDSHLTYSLMMLKRWVQSEPIDNIKKTTLSAGALPWIKSNILSKTPDLIYMWQLEVLNTGDYKKLNWESFVDDSFMNVGKYKQTANSIPAAEWVYGTDDTPIRMVNDITGIDISTDTIKTWQRGNRDLLAEHGLSTTSTKEECIAYFKNYWNLNSIPCVTAA